MKDVSAPYMARFSLNTPRHEPDMVAHNLPDMLENIARVLRMQDPRFRGYIEVYTSAESALHIVEVNLLGMD